ncbi:MAG: hypothetical protein WC121_11455 [Candidatus Kapaibacterium sp.]
MKHYLQILLILLPTILLSAEWEKVDLPNLNNGHIENAFYYDWQYVLQKWDGSFIGSNNLKDWKDLDSNYTSEYSFQVNAVDSARIYEKEFSDLRKYYDKVHFNKSDVLFFNKKDTFINFSNYDDLRKKLITLSYDIISNDIIMIKSLDNSFYFYTDSTLYEFKNNLLEEIKVTNISEFKDGLIMFNYKGELKILFEESGKDFESKISVINFHDDKFSIENKILDNLQMNYELYVTNNYLILNRPPTSVAIDIESEFSKTISLDIPNNNYLYEFYIYGDTLYIYDLRQYAALFYSIPNKTFIGNDIEYLERSEKYYKIWDMSLRIFHEFNKDSHSLDIFYEIYKKDKLIKRSRLEGEYYSIDYVRVIYEDEGNCLLDLDGEFFKINKETLELTKESNKSGRFEFVGKILYYYPIHNHKDSINYEVSYDYGDTWSKYNLYRKLLNKDYITDCGQVPNSHKLVFVNDDLYSFTVDSIFHSKVGSSEIDLLGYYKTMHHYRYKDYLYFLDENTSKVYQIKDSENIIELPLDKVTNKKITSIDLNNGYLYATDLYNLYRLKLE